MKNELKQIRKILKRSLNLVILNIEFHQLNIVLKSKFKVIANRHQKKRTNLKKKQESKINKSTNRYIKNTVKNILSYQLTTGQYNALSDGLDHHIPCKYSSNRVNTKSNSFIKVVFYISILNMIKV